MLNLRVPNYAERTLAYWRRRREAQACWINNHGRTLTGYTRRYSDGSAKGDRRAEDIYRADVAVLRELDELVRHWRAKVEEAADG